MYIERIRTINGDEHSKRTTPAPNKRMLTIEPNDWDLRPDMDQALMYVIFKYFFIFFINNFSVVQGYPYSGSGVGVYSPLKLDLGGLVIGAIIGVGALLIVPKLVGAFQGGYGGGNYRSIYTNEARLSEIKF